MVRRLDPIEVRVARGVPPQVVDVTPPEVRVDVLHLLKGPKGDKGDPGEPGEPGVGGSGDGFDPSSPLDYYTMRGEGGTLWIIELDHWGEWIKTPFTPLADEELESWIAQENGHLLALEREPVPPPPLLTEDEDRLSTEDQRVLVLEGA